jgi:hypothetical protein
MGRRLSNLQSAVDPSFTKHTHTKRKRGRDCKKKKKDYTEKRIKRGKKALQSHFIALIQSKPTSCTLTFSL